MVHDRQSGAAPPRAEIAGWAWTVGFWLIYVFLVSQLAILRAQTLPCFEDSGASYLDLLRQYLFDRTAGRPNFRIMAPLLLAGLESAANALHPLLFVDATSSAFHLGTPWPLEGRIDARVASCAPRFAVHLVFTGIVLLPVAYAVRAWVGGPGRRIVLLALVFWAALGWPPVVADALFAAARPISDWPRSYFLFDATFHNNDMLVLGIVFLTSLIARNMHEPRALFIAVFAAAAQLTNEYLGVLCALALFSGTFFSGRDLRDRPRLRLALRRFAIALSAAVAAAVLGAVAFFALGGHVGYLGDYSNGPPASVRNNFGWIKTNIANLITVVLPPLVPGFLIGLVFALRGNDLPAPWQARRETAILATIFAWYLAVFAIGLFTVDYPSDIGRQFMPVAVLNVLLGFSLARWAVAARYDRTRVSP